jgi:hypothetical protein
VRESPTDIGKPGIWGAIEPASKIAITLGQWSFWASIVAAIGTPVPTNTVELSSITLDPMQTSSSRGL